MDTTEKFEEINQHRRSFLGTAVVTVAAAQLLLNGSAEAQPSKTRLAGMRAVKPGTNTSFASLKQIDAGLLSIGSENRTGDRVSASSEPPTIRSSELFRDRRSKHLLRKASSASRQPHWLQPWLPSPALGAR